MDKRKIVGYVIFGLIGLGLLSELIRNPSGYIIPIVIFGVVFYFLKFPPKGGFRLPSWFSKTGSSRHPRGGYGYKPQKKKKTHSFRVIRGQKKNNENDEDPPPFH
jgi:hypothetical protein